MSGYLGCRRNFSSRQHAVNWFPINDSLPCILKLTFSHCHDRCSTIISFSYLRNWIIQFCFALCSCPGERTSKSGECANKSYSAECNTASLNRHKLDIIFSIPFLCVSICDLSHLARFFFIIVYRIDWNVRHLSTTF